MQRLKAKARAELEALGSKLQADGLSARLETRVGNEIMEIEIYAEEHDVDMLVIGTHGPGGVEHLLLRSVAEKAMRRAPYPVLMVRPPKA